MAPVLLRCGRDEHLPEVDEGEKQTERQHGEEEQFLVAAHLPNVEEHPLQRIAAFRFFLHLFFIAL